jgi:hypothetical protein
MDERVNYALLYLVLGAGILRELMKIKRSLKKERTKGKLYAQKTHQQEYRL